MPKYADLTGQRFGRLVVVCEASERSNFGAVRWQCKCDCGNTSVVETGNLKGGHVKSCGCLKHNSRSLDLIGDRFGSLVVIEKLQSPTQRNNHQAWLCQCDCGRTCEARSTVLRSGRKMSCGCLNGFKKNRKKIYKSVTGNDVPDGYSVIFLDGNQDNQTAENMYCISHAAYNKMLTNGWFSPNSQITLTSAMIAELNAMANRAQNNMPANQ